MLPVASSEIKYVTASKTHCSHALKLPYEQGRTLFNEGDIKIAPRDDDVEWHEILRSGPICAIYGEDLYDDYDAIQTLMNEDNLNSAIEMRADETQVLNRICRLVDADLRAGSANTASAVNVADLVARVRQLGALTFSDEDITHLIRFRASLKAANVCEAFLQSQWALTQGRIRVRCVDFGVIAGLDPRVLWVKAAVAMRQFVGALNEKVTMVSKNFAGRTETFAKKLSGKGFQDLCGYPDLLLQFESILKGIIRHYRDHAAGADAGKILRARARLISDVGKHVLAAVTYLERIAARKAAGASEEAGATEKYFKSLLETCKEHAEDKHRQLLGEAGPLFLRDTFFCFLT